jgi:acetoacetyl-CoA reductase
MPLQIWPFDVTDHEAVSKAIRQITDEIGPIDILVNAAGITRDASLRKLTVKDWDAVIRTNLDSVYHATRAVLDRMVERGFGRVINISSVNGQRGQFGQTNYSAAKAGMHGFTMALARELGAKGITVNSISPGYIESPLTAAVPEEVREGILADIPVGRFGQPEEVANVVSFLAAEDASYITGANIPINGGYHMN